MKKLSSLILSAVVLTSLLGPVGAAGAKGTTPENSLQATVSFEDGISSSEVASQKLIDFERNALNAIQQESNLSSKSNVAKNLDGSDVASENNEVFNYISTDENFTYLYESYTDGREAKILVGENQENAPIQSINNITPLAAVNLPDGWGGRQRITSSGSVLTTSVNLPSSVTKAGNGVPYIYVGFSGSKESDMGLQYAMNRGPAQNQPAWVPYMRLSGGVYGSQVAPNDQVSYKNGYKQGTTVGFQAYRNYNNTGKVRLTTFGYAICSDYVCTNTGNYYLTTIVEYTMAVTSISSWKVLATVAVLSGQTEGTATYSTTFNNIVIDFVAVPSANFQTPEEDYATISRTSNNVTINVKKTS
ncbi:YrpD family protein [Paenibacillus pinihumi]|uniref:YrpD family protein n=1 Tax=Paenibacillus pinihumi TaxID=669462 RepID=UPI00041C0E8D|nr:YrpD family protein [Paenibacillus pinihumi]